MGPSSATLALAGLAAAWAAYGALHSTLASLRLKRWVAARHPALMPAYRLAYNALALALLLPPLHLMHALRGAPLWAWHGWAGVLADGLALAAVAGFAWTLAAYDMAGFLGLRQWREHVRAVADQERFTLTPLHRLVRHPWYCLALVIVWTRDMEPAFLVSALCWTAYLALGAHLEERKLVAFHGEAYRRYQARVPALLPRPWRRLTRAEAAALEALARADRGEREEGRSDRP